MYNLVKKLLFKFDPESVHHFTLGCLGIAHQLKLTTFFKNPKTEPFTLMGLHFPNRIGLAAGFDRNGKYIDALSTLGFGFIEIGTVTPKPEAGNARPRIYRLPQQEGIINRIGFANEGLECVVNNLKKMQFKGILGVNVGKNRDTPLDKAIDDYLICFRKLWPFASYLTINISSPNTPGLRELQHGHFLMHLLEKLKQEQQSIAKEKYVPLVVKISPDLTENEIDEFANTLLKYEIDGVIATNTTLNGDTVQGVPESDQAGGLSGRPLHKRSNTVIREFRRRLQNKIPIIACGGIMDENSAKEKVEAGAQLFQLYSGLIYSGPGLIKRLVYSTSK